MMTDPIPILFVDTSPTPTRGGAQKSLLSILRLLDKNQYPPAVLMHVPHGIENELERLHIPYFIHNAFIPPKEKQPIPQAAIEPTNYQGNRYDLAYRIKSLCTIERKRFFFTRKVIRNTRARLLYLNGNYTSAHGALLAAKSMRLPVIAHQRRLSVYTLLDRMLSRWIDRMIMYSSRYAEYLQRLQVRPRSTTVIYNGINIDQLPNLHATEIQHYQTEFQLMPGIPVLCQIGTVHPVKGQELILQAVMRMWNPQAPFYLLFVGELRDSAYVSQLKEMIQNTSIEAFIRFLGERSDALQILSLCDLSLEATQAEAGFSRVVIESLCMGKIIVAPQSGCSEILQDKIDGFLYPDGSVHGCAEAIQAALESTRNPVPRTHESFAALFDEREMIRKIEAHIAAMVEQNHDG